MGRQLVERYNDRVLASDGMGAASGQALDAALRTHQLMYGERPLCRVLRPNLLTEADYAYLASATGAVLRALERLHVVAQHVPEVMAVLAPTAAESAAMRIDAGYASAAPLSRLDGFYDPAARTLQFVEYNAETPAGVGYVDELADVFLAMPATRHLAESRTVRAVRGMPRLLKTLVALKDEAGVPGPPQVAILDRDDVPTWTEFEILAQAFEDRGVATRIGTLEELSFRGGQLYLAGYPVNIVYKRMLIPDLLESMGETHPLRSALNDGAAVMANPFQCRLLHKKSTFAVLTDERFAEHFHDAHRAAVQRYLPWTRLLEHRMTQFDGQACDLVELVVTERDRFVLKPNDDYGGRGVVLGWEADADAWTAAVHDGLERPTVVQERVAPVVEAYPVWDGARVALEDRLVDLDPYCYYGTGMHGTLTRLAPGGLLNVTAGTGSVVPTLIVGHDEPA